MITVEAAGYKLVLGAVADVCAVDVDVGVKVVGKMVNDSATLLWLWGRWFWLNVITPRIDFGWSTETVSLRDTLEITLSIE